ncbi:TPA: hypothetical protein ACUNF5_002117 [Burkholderia orbicola]|uniref:hypothetical protein n=1 Tax=Burkholderia cenocepacia TaxID=95486 RepID=UPI0021AB27E3|nr:hypothetical protein [Burkholderia cenocepacia]
MIVTPVLPAVATTDGAFAPVHVTVVPLPGAVAEHAAYALTGTAPVRIAIPLKPRFRAFLFIFRSHLLVTLLLKIGAWNGLYHLS